MPRSTDRILATHVGSLIRPPELIAHLEKIESGEEYDDDAYEACLSEAIADVVARQVEAGMDIVSDGEFSKGKTWAFYVQDRLAGIERRPMTPEELEDPMVGPGGGRDREAFPEFYAEWDKATGLGSRLGMRAVCTGPIAYTGHDRIARDIANLKAAMANAGCTDAFLPVVAPASAMPGAKYDDVYADEDAFLDALADALHEEYKAITDAGLIAQIDDAFLPYMHERLVPPMTMEEYRAWAERRVDALNRARRGIPRERTRYHICWGSWNGPHMFDVPIREILDLLLKLNVGALLFENANPRHEHEWRVWEEVKLPEGMTVVPGVISHATNIVEHPELVAERIVRIARLVGRENVMGGTDCGFAQSPFARRVHPTIMWAKLRALSEGCRLASEELWGRRGSAA